MPVTKQELDAACPNPMDAALSKKKITPTYLANKLHKELNAKTTRHIKIKGDVNEESLPKTLHKVVATSDDETVIAVQMEDLGIRQRARQDAHKLRGDYAPSKTEHSGSVVVERTDEEREELKAIAQGVARALQMQGKDGE